MGVGSALMQGTVEGPPAAGRTTRVLVVDDDPALCELLTMVLEGEGYAVTVASDAAHALEAAREESIELVVLDVGLGSDDGRMVLSEIHRARDVPVIFISGRGDTADRILGLRLGADDYLAKPFSPIELAARVASVLRRSRQRSSYSVVALHQPGLSVDTRTREVSIDGEVVELTAKEFDLLAFLVRSPRQVFSRGQLLEHVWASGPGWQDEATVTEHVRRVRHKIEKDPAHPRWLTTVRGVGYRFEP